MVTSERVYDLIAPSLKDTDFELMAVKVRNFRGRVGFYITLDHHLRGITLDECTSWSRKFEDLLDMAEFIPRNYSLEVSSPGIGQPLKHEWQFRKNIGRTLTLNLLDSTHNPASVVKYRGELAEVQAETLLFTDGTSHFVRDIVEAKVELPW